MPTLKSAAPISKKFKSVARALVFPTVVISLLGGFCTLVASGETKRQRDNTAAITEAFNQGQKRLVMPDGELYGLVTTIDKDGNTVVSTHAAKELDANGDIKSMHGDVEISVTLPAKKDPSPK